MKRVLALVALLVAGICEGGSDLRVEDCLAAVRTRPDDQESYHCFFVAARREQLWSESVAALEALLAVDEDNPRALLALGSIESDRRQPRAEELFSRAAEQFADMGDLQGEVDARLGLANFLASRARYDEQREQIEIALRLARTAGDEELLSAALLAHGSYFAWSGRLDLAENVFAELPDLAELNPLLRARAHRSLALHDWFSGRLDAALTHYRTAAGLYADNGDRFMEASALYDVTLTTSKLVAQGSAGAEQLDEALDATLRAAVAGGNQQTRAQALLMIGQAPHRPLAERIPVVEEALAIHRSMGTYKEACFAVRLLARLVVMLDPADYPRGLELLEQAVDMARAVGSLEDEARALIVRAGLGSSDRSRDEVIADYARAVEAVERLRDLQPDNMVRARMLWDWAFIYYRMAGYLLGGASLERAPFSASLQDVDLAFRTVEKLRARILLDAMDSAQATEAINRHTPEARELTPLLERIQDQRQRLDAPGLPRSEREQAISELAALEADERALRRNAAEADPAYALLRRPEIPGIGQLQASLAEDEALILFQLSTRRQDAKHWYWNGGSYALVVTRERIEGEALEDADLLEDRVAVFLGVLPRRDELEAQAAASLYEDLLGPLLRKVDRSRIRRLVVVPDGSLHRLPFAALRERATEDPLAARYAISTVPSASLWFQRRQGSDEPRLSLVALADPVWPQQQSPAPPTLRNELGPLPTARAEARAWAEAVGGERRVLTGAAATERALARADLGKVGLLHFATHAVIDPLHPENSAIVLAPGGADDGLLHIREIVDMDLQGTVVVLSACASASGELTAGEGVLGLARAFFQAGADTVIATLWPVRDAEAGRFMFDVSREVSRGQTIGDAFDEVQRAWIARGEPTDSWAGFVLMGDTQATLAPATKRPGFNPAIVASAVIMLVVLAAALVLRRST